MQFLLTTLNAKYIHLNLAIRLLYELNKAHTNLSWKEFTIKDNLDEVADYCSHYEVVAFSCYIWNITQTLQVCKKIKQLNPSTKIMLGGPEVSYDWQPLIESKDIDFIIEGEGEIAFSAFIASYPHVDAVPSLIRKINGVAVKNLVAPNFDLQSFAATNPYHNEPPTDLANKVLYIETSRGCPYKCEFCLASLDNKVRYLPNEHIKSNLQYLMQYGKTIKFLDRTFNIKKDFTIDMFQFILDNHRAGNVFQFEITADIVHPDIIAFIQAHVPKGLFRFEIGIQTVNQKANLEVSRKQNFEKTKSIINQLKDKVDMHLDLIVGLPLDYWEDIKYSFEEVFKIFAPELQLGFLKFLKGTPVRDKYEQHAYVFDPVAPYQIIESKYLSKEELHRITVVEHALEIYWNKKRTIHTLKYVTAYYSIFDFLLGLGTYFATQRDFHKFTLNDIYTIIHEYALQQYPYDNVLRELIAIDYYLQYKVRPKQLFIEEPDKATRQQLIEQYNLNIHKFRYVLMPIHFDWEEFVQQNIIVPKSTYWIVQYNGVKASEVVSTITGLQLN